MFKYIGHVSHIIALYCIGNIIFMVPISNIISTLLFVN